MRRTRLISELIADEYPVAAIARRLERFTRQDIYNYLTPAKSHYRLTDEKLQRIAEFEGRAFSTVKREYEARSTSDMAVSA